MHLGSPQSTSISSLKFWLSWTCCRRQLACQRYLLMLGTIGLQFELLPPTFLTSSSLSNLNYIISNISKLTTISTYFPIFLYLLIQYIIGKKSSASSISSYIYPIWIYFIFFHQTINLVHYQQRPPDFWNFCQFVFFEQALQLKVS